MSKTKKIIITSFVAVLLICSILTISIVYTRNRRNAEMAVDDEVYEGAENTLMGFLGMEDEKIPLESSPKGGVAEEADDPEVTE